MDVIGIGTDIIECLRIAQLIERHGEQFIRRVYTDHEIEFCSSKPAATQLYASRWVGKEAVLKALGTGWVPGMAWRDIEIRAIARERPIVRFGGIPRQLCEQLGVGDVMLSISHCRTHATAYALALAEED